MRRIRSDKTNPICGRCLSPAVRYAIGFAQKRSAVVWFANRLGELGPDAKPPAVERLAVQDQDFAFPRRLTAR